MVTKTTKQTINQPSSQSASHSLWRFFFRYADASAPSVVVPYLYLLTYQAKVKRIVVLKIFYGRIDLFFFAIFAVSPSMFLFFVYHLFLRFIVSVLDFGFVTRFANSFSSLLLQFSVIKV